MLLSWGFAEQEYQCRCGRAASILQGWHRYGTKPKGEIGVLEEEWSVLGPQHMAGIALPRPCASMCISIPMHGSIPVHIQHPCIHHIPVLNSTDHHPSPRIPVPQQTGVAMAGLPKNAVSKVVPQKGVCMQQLPDQPHPVPPTPVGMATKPPQQCPEPAAVLFVCDVVTILALGQAEERPGRPILQT